MTRQDKILISLLAAVAIVVPLAIGFGLHWVLWQSVLLILCLLVVVFFIARRIDFNRGQERLREIMQPPPAAAPAQAKPAADEHRSTPAHNPPAYPTSPISAMSLASAQMDYRFVFSTTVHWRPISSSVAPPHANLSALAGNAIIGRAYEITRLEQPADYEIVEHKLNAELGRIVPDRTGQVENWAVQVTLTLPAADIERLHKLSEVRKNEQVWEHERNHERSRRAYLAEDVLKSPGSAIVWWLARDFSQVRETVALIGTLAQLSAAANNTEVPELFRPMVERAGNPAVPPGFDPLMLLPSPDLPEARNGSLEPPGSWRPQHRTSDPDRP